MRIVVATVVHHALDARIFHRQVKTLLEAGHEVTYLAPFGERPPPVLGGLRCRDLPRSTGLDRLRAVAAARRALAEETTNANLVIVHDPELTLLDRWIACPKAYDVHEDLVAQLDDKEWIPGLGRGALRVVSRRLERRAARRFCLLLAEDSYCRRLPGGVVVRNTPRLPAEVRASGTRRVVYLGRVSRGRGVETMVEAMRRVDGGQTLDLYGPVDRSAADVIDAAPSGVTAHGFVDNPVALRSIAGAMAGLSLLGDLPNYRHSVPSKILEYMAHGVPVITTPLPVARRVVEEAEAGIIVPFDDPKSVGEALASLADPSLRVRFSENGRRFVAESYNWEADANRLLKFVVDSSSCGSRETQ